MQLPPINLWTYSLLLAWAKREKNEWQLFDEELRESGI
jgi:hypothetical protein